MSQTNIVIDTNVLIAALRSEQGSAHRLLLKVGEGAFDINLSVPLALEYEDVSKRPEHTPAGTADFTDDVLDYVFGQARWHEIYFRWPLLADLNDSKILELAIAARCDYIVTFNKRHFSACDQFGIQVCTPFEFLQTIGANR